MFCLKKLCCVRHCDLWCRLRNIQVCNIEFNKKKQPYMPSTLIWISESVLQSSGYLTNRKSKRKRERENIIINLEYWVSAYNYNCFTHIKRVTKTLVRRFIFYFYFFHSLSIHMYTLARCHYCYRMIAYRIGWWLTVLLSILYYSMHFLLLASMLCLMFILFKSYALITFH